METAELRHQLRADGYFMLLNRVDEIRNAARAGALLWTSERLATSDASRIDARPVVWK